MDVTDFGFDEPHLTEFIELPFRLHADDAGWIPPFKAEVRRQHSEQNPFLSYGEMRSFLARDGGEAVARCSAIVNPRLKEEGEPVGLIGFFETADRPEASRAVVEAAFDWLRSKGLARVWGPMEFSIWYSYRLQTKGFDTEPFFGEPRNPAHYPEHFAALGFEPKARWYSWDLAKHHLQGLFMGAKMLIKEELVDIESFDMERFDEELEQVHAMMVDGFAENLGFTPIDYDEYRSIFAGLKGFMIPELVTWGREKTGAKERVGIGYTYPDIAPAVRALKGDASGFAAIGPEGHARLVMHTIVARKRVRKQGMVESGLGTVMERVLERFDAAVGALAKEGPTFYHKTGEPTREYTLYERRI